MKTNVIFTCVMLVLVAAIILIPAADAAKESYVNHSEEHSPIYGKATARANVTSYWFREKSGSEFFR